MLLEEVVMDDEKDSFTYTSLLTLAPSSVPIDSFGTCGCRSVNEFDKVRRLGEGTYGVVYEGRCKKTAAKV